MRFSSSPRGTVILAYRRHRDSPDETHGFGFGAPAPCFYTFLAPTTITRTNAEKNVKFKGDVRRFIRMNWSMLWRIDIYVAVETIFFSSNVNFIVYIVIYIIKKRKKNSWLISSSRVSLKLTGARFYKTACHPETRNRIMRPSISIDQMNGEIAWKEKQDWRSNSCDSRRWRENCFRSGFSRHFGSGDEGGPRRRREVDS